MSVLRGIDAMEFRFYSGVVGHKPLGWIRRVSPLLMRWKLVVYSSSRCSLNPRHGLGF